MNAESTHSHSSVDPSYEMQFYDWLKQFFRAHELQFTKCGSKTKVGKGRDHDYNLKTGLWKKRNYSGNKPPRWLYHIVSTDEGLKAHNPAKGAAIIGVTNSAQEDKSGAVFRLVPLISLVPNQFTQDDEFEVHVLFIFNGATPRGSSSEHFEFNPSNGELKFKKNALEYIFCGVLGLRNRSKEIVVSQNGHVESITYGQVVDSLAEDMQCIVDERTTSGFTKFDLTERAEFETLKEVIADSWKARDIGKSKHESTTTASPSETEATAATAGPSETETTAATAGPSKAAGSAIDPTTIEIPKNPDLVGIDSSVYRQINAALQSGKQHIMLYGPPGTGKTTLAQWIARKLPGGKSTLMTGSSDWSSQDIVGGYQPTGAGGVDFIPGVLLKNFNHPLIIDELNRCDIDKVLGPLFTVLSGHPTTLPYRTKIANKDSLQYTILPNALTKTKLKDHEYAPGENWRLIATINSIDKAALYQMSYALSRRFCWIYIDAPHDKTDFIYSYLKRANPTLAMPPDDTPCPLGNFWEKINKDVRALGPAPFIDAIEIIKRIETSPNFFEPPSPSMTDALLDALDMVLLPLLDGIVTNESDQLKMAATSEFKLDKDEHTERLARRMKVISV